MRASLAALALPLPPLAIDYMARPAGRVALVGMDLIRLAYGEDAAHAARDHACRLVATFGTFEGYCGDGDCLFIRSVDGGALSFEQIASIAARLSLSTFVVQGRKLVLLAQPVGKGAPPTPSGPVDQVSARRQLEACAALSTALCPGQDGKIEVRWRPVATLRDQAMPLYYRMEASAAPATGRTDPGAASLVTPCAEYAMIEGALAELAPQSGICIAVPLSSAWLASAAWQDALVKRVRQSAPHSARLIVVISAERGDAGNWSTFAARLRRAGTAIGMTQFGTAAMPLSDLISIEPDLIEISGALYSGALASNRFAAALLPVVTLATALAPVVVAGGIDNAGIAQNARASGLDWGWGDALRGATISRPWRMLRLVAD